MQTNAPFPWQNSAWFSLLTQIKNQRFPHALLLSGIKGLGKLEFAKHLAQLLLCGEGEKKLVSCQQCRACHQFTADTHPDFKMVQPEENSTLIKVDQIREVIDFCNHTALQNAYKIVIFYPGEALNNAAANALLKTLEEPPLNKNLLLLISHQPSLLLPTLRSRCQHIKLNPPAREIAHNWLKQQMDINESFKLVLALAEGAPLTALAFIKENKHTAVIDLLTDINVLLENTSDPVSIAEKWLKVEINEFLSILVFLITQVIRFQLDVGSLLLDEQEFQRKIGAIANIFSLEQLFSHLDFITEQRRCLENKINLNSQIVLETLFCRFNSVRNNEKIY